MNFQRVQIGSYLLMLGGIVAAGSQAVLEDTTVGSPRALGTAIGGALIALGGFLVARGH